MVGRWNFSQKQKKAPKLGAFMVFLYPVGYCWLSLYKSGLVEARKVELASCLGHYRSSDEPAGEVLTSL